MEEGVVLVVVFLVPVPDLTIVVEDSGAGVPVLVIEGFYLRLSGGYYVLQFADIIDLEDLVAPEKAVEGILHGVGVRIVVVSPEIIDRRVCHRLVLHKMAVDGAQHSLRADREHSSESLTGVGIGDLFFR